MNLEKTSIVVLTGAGISAESGIETFRSRDGLWENHAIEDVATPEAFARDPKKVLEFYNQRRRALLNPEIKPNEAHYALARLENLYPGKVVVISQNIDNLHERAGTKSVIHMHGELLKKQCTSCLSIHTVHHDMLPDEPCPSCQKNTLRPYIVWFGEMPLQMTLIYKHLKECQIFAAIGTSGNVYPAAGFAQIAKKSGATTYEVNLEPTAIAENFDHNIYGNATQEVATWVESQLANKPVKQTNYSNRTETLSKKEKKRKLNSKLVLFTPLLVVSLLILLLNISLNSNAIVDKPFNSFSISIDESFSKDELEIQNSNNKVSIKISSGDTFGDLMSEQGIDYGQTQKLISNENANTWLTQRLAVGRTIEIKKGAASNQLTSLTLQIDPNTWLYANWDEKENNFQIDLQEKQTDTNQVFVSGAIEQSLFIDARKKGVPASVIIAFANVFAWDIDFAYDLRPGDTYRMLYEERHIDGKKTSLYNILAAEIITRKKSITAIGYTPKNEETKSYYLTNGSPIQKPFLRMPIEFGRISSHFNLKRVHPLFKTVRPHRGTDYAAPTNTPIHSVAKGKITFRGKQRGYGNVVVVNHSNGISTLYGHMNKFAKGQKKGSKVSQGELIGYVGSTGFATGPHVHFEFKINGVHKNPATVELPNAPILPASELSRFAIVRDKTMNALKIQHKAMLASNDK